MFVRAEYQEVKDRQEEPRMVYSSNIEIAFCDVVIQKTHPKVRNSGALRVSFLL